MGFFKDIGKKTSETTNRITKETKLKLKINENKNKINTLYTEIGQKAYEKYLSGEKCCFEDDCKRLDELNNEIESAKKEILTLNNKKICSNCQTEIDISSQFCQKCGIKQPEDKKPENEDEEVKEVEIVENNEQKSE